MRQELPLFPLRLPNSVTTGARKLHAAKSNEHRNPYTEVNEAETEDCSAPLPGIGAFLLWLQPKVLEALLLPPPREIPLRPFARIGPVRHNGDTKRSKVNENAPPGAETMEAGHPSIVRPIW
jgi:hypothetical protein